MARRSAPRRRRPGKARDAGAASPLLVPGLVGRQSLETEVARRGGRASGQVLGQLAGDAARHDLRS
eukprot:3389737-Pyramimonas_sp.AAC.1